MGSEGSGSNAVMSGIEIAGLVLGAFPLLISAAEHYREGCESIKDWWQFEGVYLTFRNKVKTEETLFRTYMISVLLEDLDSVEDAERLCNDPDSPEWKDGVLEVSLRERFDSSYSTILISLTGMKRVMTRLQEKLGIDTSSSGEIRYQLKRIKFCLDRKRIERQLSELREHNANLRYAIEANERLQPLKRKKTFITASLKRIQERALSLYGILTGGWQCGCSAHRAHLLLEQRPMFEKENRAAGVQFKVGFEIQFTLDKLQWHESIVEITEGDIGGETPSGIAAQGATSAVPATAQCHPQSLQPRSLLANSRQQGRLVAHVNLPGPDIITNTKNVRFQSTIRDGPNKAKSVLIDDLCSAVRGLRIVSPASSYMLDECGRRHTFRCGAFGIKHDDSTNVRLADMLRKNSAARLSRPDRLRLAAVLASSTLQLYETPWLYGFDKSNITCIVDADKLNSLYPFLVKEFSTPSSADVTQTTSSSTSNSKETLLRLGILLLELCYGEALEDQEFRNNYMKDGRPNDFTGQ